ncbi:Gfo/Idh/MocA family oxidoreductase [Dehalococcoidia bacterium]|nr:Gfo/Idh/MocA family oxidoreductase [Dehalococcoidia bacterium]
MVRKSAFSLSQSRLKSLLAKPWVLPDKASETGHLSVLTGRITMLIPQMVSWVVSLSRQEVEWKNSGLFSLRHLSLRYQRAQLIAKLGFNMLSRLRNEKLLRVGFIGCGRHAKVNLYPCLRYAPIELVATCAKHKENAEATARMFGAQRAYDNYLEMFDKEKIDAVFIVVGAEQHFEMCSHALYHGLHVFVEKPATQNLEQAGELLNISEKTNKHIMVGFMKRFAPTYQRAKQIIATRDFAPLSAVDTKFCVGKSKSEEKFLIDVAIHHLDLLRFFGGEVKTLHVEKESVEKRGIFSFAITVKFTTGAIGSTFISSGQSWHAHNERVELFGNGQSIIIDNVVSFRYYRNDCLQPDVFRQSNNIFWEPNFTVPSEQNQTLFLNGFAYEIRHFADSILNGTKPKSNIEDFYYDMQLIEAIQNIK